MDPEKLQINNSAAEDKRASGEVPSQMESPAQEKKDLIGTPSKKSAKKSNQETSSGQKMQKTQQALVDNQDLIEAFEFYVKR